MYSTERKLGVLAEEAEAQGADWSVRIETAAECGWSCELRWTAKPNERGRPDRSLVFFATGGTAARALERCLEECELPQFVDVAIP